MRVCVYDIHLSNASVIGRRNASMRVKLGETGWGDLTAGRAAHEGMSQHVGLTQLSSAIPTHDTTKNPPLSSSHPKYSSLQWASLRQQPNSRTQQEASGPSHDRLLATTCNFCWHPHARKMINNKKERERVWSLVAFKAWPKLLLVSKHSFWWLWYLAEFPWESIFLNVSGIIFIYSKDKPGSALRLTVCRQI